jgi:phage head maturation protease
MKECALDSLSIGYTIGEFICGTEPNEPRRTIKNIKNLPEVSLVTFPMIELARTGAVSSGYSHAAGFRGRAAMCSPSRRQIDRPARAQSGDRTPVAAR